MDAFYDMQAAAASEGISLWILSSYRSYDDQEVIYNRYVAQDGRDAADTYSSRPRTLRPTNPRDTFDLNSLEQDFQISTLQVDGRREELLQVRLHYPLPQGQGQLNRLYV